MGQYLIVDIETSSLKVADAIIKVFGAYDPLSNEFFIYRWGDDALVKVMELFSTYKTIITFNGLKYDMPILERHGVPVSNYTHIDVYNIFRHKRTSLLRKGGFASYSMDALVKDLGLDSDGGKGILDYNILKRDVWTPEEQEAIIEYLKTDLLCTWKLWKYLLDRFNPLMKYLPVKDAELYKHITVSLPTFLYKVLCHVTGITELYDELPAHKSNPQLIVTFPSREKSAGAVLMRFTHLYAHTIMQFNLLSYDCRCCMGNEGKFHGRNYYDIGGFYCQKNQGIIEKFFRELERAPRNDPDIRLLGSIVFSQLYLVISNPLYYSLYNPHVVKDLISLAKHQLATMTRMFADKGFRVLAIDLDNVFIELDKSTHSIEDLLLVKDEIIKVLQSRMPFKSETFDLLPVCGIQYIQFARKRSGGPGDQGNFMKKGEYFYITDDGQTVIKGLSNDEVQRMMEKNG